MCHLDFVHIESAINCLLMLSLEELWMVKITGILLKPCFLVFMTGLALQLLLWQNTSRLIYLFVGLFIYLLTALPFIVCS